MKKKTNKNKIIIYFIRGMGIIMVLIGLIRGNALHSFYVCWGALMLLLAIILSQKEDTENNFKNLESELSKIKKHINIELKGGKNYGK